MKPEERDELLIRVDERTANIWKITEQQEKHLAELNTSVSKHAVSITRNSTSIKWIYRILIAAGVLGGGAGGVSGIIRLTGG